MMKMTAAFAALAVSSTIPNALLAQEGDIVVGFPIAFSGALSPYDDGPYKAALLAIDDINAAGGLLGRQITHMNADTKSDPGQGATAAIDMLSAGADVVMVTCDFDFGAPAALVAQSQNILAFSSCAADPKFGVQGIGNDAYSMASATLAQGTILAEWAWEQGYRAPYMLKDTMLEYTKSVCDSFDRRWQELAGSDTLAGRDTFHGVNDTSIAGQISRLTANAATPDVLMFCGAVNGGSAIRQIRAAGINLPIMSGEGMDGAYWLDSVPNLSDFYVVTYASVFGNDPDPAINEFVEAFTTKWGAPPVTAHALTGYSFVEAWARAAERAGTLDTDAVRAELDTFDGEPLLMGATTFTPDLHINLDREMLILEIKNGKHVPVERRAVEKTPEVRF